MRFNEPYSDTLEFIVDSLEHNAPRDTGFVKVNFPEDEGVKDISTKVKSLKSVQNMTDAEALEFLQNIGGSGLSDWTSVIDNYTEVEDVMKNSLSSLKSLRRHSHQWRSFLYGDSLDFEVEIECYDPTLFYRLYDFECARTERVTFVAEDDGNSVIRDGEVLFKPDMDRISKMGDLLSQIRAISPRVRIYANSAIEGAEKFTCKNGKEYETGGHTTPKNKLFSLKRLDRIADALGAEGHDILVSADGSELELYLPNDKEDIVRTLETINELMDYPDFVKENLFPVQAYEQLLSSGYENIEFLGEGGTRRVYQADWGMEKRIIKVDKSLDELGSVRAKRYVGRGYDTARDIKTLRSLPNPGAHGINPIRDFINLSAYGVDGSVLVEEKFGISLKDWVEVNNHQSKDWLISHYQQIFYQLADAISFLNDEVGIYHRDLNAGNILIDEDENLDLQVRITDCANACRKENVQDKAEPTMGSHYIAHPNTWHKGEVYDEKSELFALGQNMYYAITGDFLFEPLPEDNQIIMKETGEKLVDENGKFDETRYEEILLQAVRVNIFKDSRNLLENTASTRVDSQFENFMQDAVYGCLSLENGFDYCGTLKSVLDRDFIDPLLRRRK